MPTLIWLVENIVLIRTHPVKQKWNHQINRILSYQRQPHQSRNIYPHHMFYPSTSNMFHPSNIVISTTIWSKNYFDHICFIPTQMTFSRQSNVVILASFWLVKNSLPSLPSQHKSYILANSYHPINITIIEKS